MPIAFLTLELHIEAAQSIKDRRQVVRSLKDRLRTSFNVSVAELDAAELWNRATIGVVSISTSRDYLTFLRALMRGGELNGARILKAETVALMGQNHMGALNVLPMKTFNPAVSNDCAPLGSTSTSELVPKR